MVVNISGYRFVTLYNTRSLQLQLSEAGAQLGLKGSIMLSPEGINVMLAGAREAITAFQQVLNQDTRLAGMSFKESTSDTQPFEHLFVKCKKQLVPGMSEVHPTEGDTAPMLTPQQLKAWYESGKDFVMIDTRNDYELNYGTFEKALDLQLQQFSELPEKLQRLDPAIKNKPVVLFCTGGIRCERGAPAAKKLGFKEVYHLEGGILNYFKECGGAYYQGDCFVFDERVALRPDLAHVERCAA